MRKFKNIQWIILYVVLLVTTILYSFLSNSEQTEVMENEKISLTFRHVWTLEHDQPILNIFRNVVKEYESAHPNVKIKIEGLDQNYHREQKLKSEMVTGTPPDMFVLFGGAELDPYAESNRLLDLRPFIEENELKFRDLSLWTYGEQVFGLPYEGHAQPIFYNKSIFQELNINPPTTIDELSSAMKVLKDHNYIPFTFGNEELWPGGVYAHYLMDRYAGPQLIYQIANGEKSFNNKAYKQAFDHLQQWVTTDAFNSDYSNIASASAIQLFNEGKAAMYLNGSWDITLFRSPDGSNDIQQHIGVIPFPALEKGETRSIAGGYTIGIGLSSHLTDAQKMAALEFMKAFYTDEVQLQIVYESARLPSMNVIYDTDKTGPVFSQVVELLSQSEQVFLAYDNVLPPEVRTAFWTITDRLFKLELSSDEALQQLDLASESYFNLVHSYGGDSAESQ